MGHHAAIGGEEEEPEVLRRQETGFVAFQLSAPNGEAGLDDAARIDPASQPYIVFSPAPVRHESEFLDVFVLVEDAKDFAHQMGNRSQLDPGPAIQVRVAEGDEGIV
jgi:hypothetical protein